jgi:opacity protein-like surface antigen
VRAAGGGLRRGCAAIKTNALELVGVGLLPITDNFSLYLKAGIFRYEADSTTSGAAVGTSSQNGTEFTVGAGIQYAFTRNIAARFEYQRYNDIIAGVIGFDKEDITVWRLAARIKF